MPANYYSFFHKPWVTPHSASKQQELGPMQHEGLDSDSFAEQQQNSQRLETMRVLY